MDVVMDAVTNATDSPAIVIPFNPYNGTEATGGDSMTINLNQWYQSGDLAFILVATALVWLMVPGVGFFYSGLARRKSALSLLWVCMVAVAVTQFQWYLWGYSLAFSKTGTSGFIGDLSNIGLRNTLAAPSVGSPLIPDILYCNFQGMFASVTIALIVGAIAERGRLLPACVFIFVWVTVVYCTMAYWVWNPNGWAYKWGVLDYAGGGPVEIGSGVGALAYSLVLGRRRNSPSEMVVVHRPHSVTSVVLGTAFLWFGWMGFNGGSAFGANIRAVISITTTNIAGSLGGITWVLLDYRLEKSWSMVGFCSGCIAGLVAATPSSGFVPPWAGVAIGIVSGAACNYGTKLKYLIKVDDAMDVFAEHGIGGVIGLLATGVFGASYIAALDGVTYGDSAIPGGFLDRHWSQLYKQLVWCLVCAVWTFVMTTAICLILDKLIPGMKLRATEEGEMKGIDEDQIGEFAFDYVEARRNFLTTVGVEAGGDDHDHHSSDSSNRTNEKQKAQGDQIKTQAGNIEMDYLRGEYHPRPGYTETVPVSTGTAAPIVHEGQSWGQNGESSSQHIR